MGNIHSTNGQFEKIKTVDVFEIGLDLHAAVVRRLEARLKGAKLSLLFAVSVRTEVSIGCNTTMQKYLL